MSPLASEAQAYPLRAACFVKTYQQRSTVNAHHDWAKVVFCGTEAMSDRRLSHFHRAITHVEATKMIAGYPSW
jgi:hypothetical protein